MIKWIDTHTHIDIIEKNPNLRQGIIKKSIDSGMESIIHISTDLESYFNGKILSLNNKGQVYTTAGLYPSHAEDYGPSHLEELKEQLREGVAIAVGECGLDYHWNYGTPELQKKLFRDQINLSKDFNLPLVIHARDSYDDVHQILKKDSPPAFGVMHCFGGSPEDAEKFLELGFYISFAGNITYKNAHGLRESCIVVPLEKLLLETDAPYLTPVPHRGKKNEPSYIAHTGEFVAKLRGVSVESLSQITRNNAKRLFRLA